MRNLYKNILVPVDDSKQAELALQKAIKICSTYDCKLTIAHVIDEIYYHSADPHVGVIDKELRPYIKDMLDKYERMANEGGVQEIELVITKGKPKLEISNDLVRDYKVDLVMMGATGMSAIDKLLMGSTSEYVLRHASCDVLIVR